MRRCLLLPLLALALSGAAPADEAFLRGARVVFALPAQGDAPRLLFVGTGNVTEQRPDIVVVGKDGPRRVPLDAGAFEQAGWVHVAATPDRRRVFAVLDMVVESPGWTLHLLRSEDGGRTWARSGDLKKPHYFATFGGLRLGPDGRGEVVVTLDADFGGDVAPGEYVARTTDGGRTWTPFARRPDVLVAAEAARERGGERPTAWEALRRAP